MKSDTFLSLVIFFCFLPKYSQQAFWRPTTPAPLPSNPNARIYQELQKIPSPNTTAKKLLDNFIRFKPPFAHITLFGRAKRSPVEEDVVIILDGSGSVGSCEFKRGREALTNLIRICQEKSSYSCRHAGITYASWATVNFKFLPREEAIEKMKVIPYRGGGTNTQAALVEAEKLFINNIKAGGRTSPDVKMVLLVTDGQSNINDHLTVPNARRLKKMGVKIFVVAVGQFVRGIKEMAKVASFPPQKYVYRVKKYGGFLDVVNLASSLLLQTKPPAPSPPC